jgi:hypothetical protein
MRRAAEFLARPGVQRRINGWAVVLWVAMIPVSLVLHWLSSVTYVAALSIWALVTGHLSSWVSAMVAEHQDNDADVQDVMDHLESRESPADG